MPASVVAPLSVLPLPIDSLSNDQQTLSLSTPKRKFRAIEVHILHTIEQIDLMLIFEGFPLWLLSLEPVWVRSILIVGFSDHEMLLRKLTDRGYPLLIFQRALSRFATGKIRYTLTLPGKLDEDLVLISGQLSFLISTFERLSTVSQPVIGTIDSHVHCRFHFGRPANVNRDLVPFVTWHRIRHATVGGASNFIAVHGTMNGAELTPRVSSLRRAVGDFLDHGIRPSHLRSMDACSQPVLQVTDRVSPLHWDQPLVYPTRFFGSGFGIRSLTTGELCSIFSFPVRIRTGDVPMQVFDVCIPVQLLQAILHPFLEHFHSRQDRSPKRQRRDTSTINVVDLPGDFSSSTLPPNNHWTNNHFKSWIPALKRWLPHSWIATEIVTPGAVKRDDADIPTHLWNKRLQLLYPRCSDQHLDQLRTFLLCKVVRRNVWRSFRCYLIDTYGINWADQLKALRSSQQSGGSTLFHDVKCGIDVINSLGVQWYQLWV